MHLGTFSIYIHSIYIVFVNSPINTQEENEVLKHKYLRKNVRALAYMKKKYYLCSENGKMAKIWRGRAALRAIMGCGVLWTARQFPAVSSTGQFCLFLQQSFL